MENENTTPPLLEDTNSSYRQSTFSGGSGISTQNENDWVMITHFSGLLAFTSIPAIFGPLLVWLLKKDQFPRVDSVGKDAINFHLTMLLVILVSLPFVFILIGIIPIVISYVLSIIFAVVGGFKANRGEIFRYPFTIQFIK